MPSPVRALELAIPLGELAKDSKPAQRAWHSPSACLILRPALEYPRRSANSIVRRVGDSILTSPAPGKVHLLSVNPVPVYRVRLLLPSSQRRTCEVEKRLLEADALGNNPDRQEYEPKMVECRFDGPVHGSGVLD